ncbi:cytochrome c [bacterium]|nr:MAG: cytochrome c [bacterium]
MRSVLLAAVLTSPAAAQPVLEARAKGVAVASGTAAQLSARVATSRVVIENPFLDGRAKAYEAFPAAPLLDALYGRGWREVDGGEVTFKASDGYEAHVAAAKLAAGGAWLAFRDHDRAPRWEPVGKRAVDPGPFFLVWEGGKTPEKGYAWPWQVVALDTARFEDVYPGLAPRGVKGDSPEARGYKLFRLDCVKCHGLDQEGGKVGPDLNSPQSVTEYRPKDQLKAFIRKPSSFRFGQMPDHESLSDKDLEDLWRYLKLKAGQRQKSW